MHDSAVSSASPRPLVGGAPLTIPVREIVPWAVLFGTLLLMVLYFVGAEEGALSLFTGSAVHEFVHDGRHLLGFPCH
jgi:hypothetical protein